MEAFMTESPRFKLSRSQRLRASGDFERVFARRCTAHESKMGLYVDINDCGYPRLGIRISKRFGGAVKRVRARRRMKEAFRLNQHALKAMDYIVVLRSTEESTQELSRLLLALDVRVQRKFNRDVSQQDCQ